MTNQTRPRILIAMIEAGSGHKRPALAIRDSLEHLYPGRFDIDVLDFMSEVGDVELDRLHKDSWNWMLRHPQATMLSQWLVDNVVPLKVTRWVQGRLLQKHAERVASFLRVRPYDLIVTTHFLSLQTLAIAKTRLGLNTPVVGFNTELFDGHALWAERRIDEMIVSTREAAERLISFGIPESRIKVLGYPINLAFLEDNGGSAGIRQKLGLDPNLLTLLHVTGGEGVGGQTERFVEAVMKADLALQYIVICGRNTGMYERLSQLTGGPGKTSLVVHPYVDNMHEWVGVSDIVLGKAGAASTFEALYAKRPILFTSIASLSEKRNVDFCRQNGLGSYVRTPEELLEVLRPIVSDSRLLDPMVERLRNLDMRAGTIDIARHLAGYFPAPYHA
jgi:1,2-diacylglycerol 3-beta-galactosyltransferase